MVENILIIFIPHSLKDALQAANIKSSSSELEAFFKIIVRMEKEDGIVLKKGDSFFDKNLSSGIHTLFETLGHTNIINLMKGVRKNINLVLSDYSLTLTQKNVD